MSAPPPPAPTLSVSPTEIRWSGLTDIGRFRKNNEDAFLALTVDGREVRYLGKTGQAPFAGADFVFAVSDGMGGANSGEFASRIAVDRITRLFPRSFRLAAAGLDRGIVDILLALFTDIHSDLLTMSFSYEECAGMGATLSLAWVTPGQLYFAHLGDSRIYHLPREGGMKQLTDDHTHLGWLRRQGKLNEREARMHPGRNALNQALGAGHQFISPHLGVVACEAGDRFVLCTDGVIDGLWDRRIEEVVRETPAGVPNVAELLVREAVDSSGRDNATAVVIDVLPGVLS